MFKGAIDIAPPGIAMIITDFTETNITRLAVEHLTIYADFKFIVIGAT